MILRSTFVFSLPIPQPQFTIRNLAIRNSQFQIPNSKFQIHNSKFAIRNSSSPERMITTHQPRPEKRANDQYKSDHAEPGRVSTAPASSRAINQEQQIDSPGQQRK